MTRMRLDDYLDALQRHEGLSPVSLIRGWTTAELKYIDGVIRAATSSSGLIRSTIPNFAGTNQSKGNQAAEHFSKQLSKHLPSGHFIRKAHGQGYPDRILVTPNCSCFMELKATSRRDDKDGNRRVLTSSPIKMINLIKNQQVDPRPVHLLCTILYNDPGGIISGLRLDFLEPDTQVDTRFEASTSHSLLSQGGHQTRTIP